MLLFTIQARYSYPKILSLSCKSMTRVEVTDSGKHSSLLWYGVNYCRIKFYDTGPGGRYYETFTAQLIPYLS